MRVTRSPARALRRAERPGYWSALESRILAHVARGAQVEDDASRSATSPGRRSPPRPSSCSSPARRWCTPSASTRATRTRASSPRHRRPSRPPREASVADGVRRSTTCYRTERPSMEVPSNRLSPSSSAHCSSAACSAFRPTACSGGTSSPAQRRAQFYEDIGITPSSVRSWTRCSTPGTAGWTAS